MVEILSIPFFALEYLLRQWSAPVSPRFRGRLRFSLRPLLLIDLAVMLPFMVLLFVPSREVTMRLLRLGWSLRHLKLLRSLWTAPVANASLDVLLGGAEAHLADIRQKVALGRERDLARIDRHIDAVSQPFSQVSERHRRVPVMGVQGGSPLTLQGDIDASPVMTLIDDLATQLKDTSEIEAISSLITGAYQETAGVFDTVPRRVDVEVSLDGGHLIGQKRVPLRRMGQTSFRPLVSRYPASLQTRDPMYVAEVDRELARIRATMIEALAQEDVQASTVAFNRAVNQLRDLGTPVRLAWDGLLFELEQMHERQLQIVRTDIGRYGGPAFYLGRGWRWILRGLVALALRLIEFPKRLWALLQRWRQEGWAIITRLLRPALKKLGLIKTPTLELLRAFDEARLDSVTERGLPADYLKHFEFDILKDKGLFFGFDEEFSRISLVISRWREGYQSSFIVYGHRGVGKSTLLHMARQQLLSEDLVTHAIITEKVTTVDAATHYLASLLELPDAHDFESLAKGLLERPPCAVLLEDCHHLFFRNIGGLSAIRYFLWLIAKTNHHVLWGIAIETRGYEFLNRVLPLNDLFHVQINLHERSGEELRRLMMVRHSRSGRSLHYLHDKSNEKALRRQLKRLRRERRSGRANLQEALELTYFDRLATACAGNISVAIFYWLRALKAQGPERFEVMPFEELDLSLIWDLSQNEAFLLVAILQHGKLTAAELAKILDADDIDTRLGLEILGNHNIVQLDYQDETFEVNPVVLKMAVAMLQSRNLLQ